MNTVTLDMFSWNEQDMKMEKWDQILIYLNMYESHSLL